MLPCVHFPAGAFFWRKNGFLKKCDIPINKNLPKSLKIVRSHTWSVVRVDECWSTLTNTINPRLSKGLLFGEHQKNLYR